MNVFTDLRTALMDLVTTLPKLNKDNRKEVREIIMQLEGELQRSLTLAIFYLDGVSRIKPKKELIDHLQAAPTTLIETYNQYKICAGLYDLSDRFKQWFATIRGSIAVGKISSVETLINDLANGERIVLDHLKDTTTMLSDAATELQALTGEPYEQRKKSLYQRVELERKELKSQQEWLSKTVREVLKQF